MVGAEPLSPVSDDIDRASFAISLVFPFRVLAIRSNALSLAGMEAIVKGFD
jgi:hypothetical protein